VVALKYWGELYLIFVIIIGMSMIFAGQAAYNWEAGPAFAAGDCEVQAAFLFLMGVLVVVLEHFAYFIST